MIRNFLIGNFNFKFSYLIDCSKRATSQLSKSLPNFQEYALKICNIQAETGQKLLKVKWNDGFETQFPFVWLLDSARFSNDGAATAGRLSLNELNLEAEPQDLTLSQDGRNISIRWLPYREAVYESDWLKRHAPPATEWASQRAVVPRRHAVSWGRAQMELQLPTLEASDLGAKNPSEMRDKLADFAKYGILLIKGCPEAINVLQKLGVNADRPHLTTSPGAPMGGSVQVVRTGGVNTTDAPPALAALHVRSRPLNADASLQLVDGFRVAEQLQEVQPALFDFLTRTPVHYVSEQNALSVSRPVFTLSTIGEVIAVSFDNSLRAFKLMQSPQVAHRFYEALKVFNACCYQSRNLLNLQVEEGDFILLDNRRILHGRTIFLSSGGDQASVQETYFEDIF